MDHCLLLLALDAAKEDVGRPLPAAEEPRLGGQARRNNGVGAGGS